MRAVFLSLHFAKDASRTGKKIDKFDYSDNQILLVTL